MTTIVPEVTPLTQLFWENARRGVVMLQRCAADGHSWHPPQPTCPRCRSTQWEWVASSGRGRIHSFAVVRHAAHPAVVGRLPYAVCLVELEEGPLFLCDVLDWETAGCEVGAPVELVLGPSFAGFDLPQAKVGAS